MSCGLGKLSFRNVVPWAFNGTTEVGHGGGLDSGETSGTVNTSWNGDAPPALASNLQSLISSSGRPATGRYELSKVTAILRSR